jgi:arsenite-transporting ATPase
MLRATHTQHRTCYSIFSGWQLNPCGNDNRYNRPVHTLSFFVGKGGVGKTTVSASYAVRMARQHPGQRVLLLSTDPAHSLSDILQVPLRDEPRKVPLPGASDLRAWQIDAETLFAEFLAEHRQSILQVLDAGSIFSRDDIEPLLNTTLPGMAEVSALLAIHRALDSGEYFHIVVDTAPFGHTLRLFGLPQHFLRFLNFLELAASRDRVLAAHFGGTANRRTEFSFIELWKKIVRDVENALIENAKLFLVTTPEKFSLNESVRCADELRTYSPPLEMAEIVLNRCVLQTHDCGSCQNRLRATKAARRFLNKHFPLQRLHLGEDPGLPLVGITALTKFGDHVFAGRELKLPSAGAKLRPVRLEKVKWPALDVPLTFVLGKGGVGKTTISAALGFTTRKRKGHAVQICSVDPAPSLDDIFQKAIGDDPVPVLGDANFLASEMDSAVIFARWVRDLKADIESSTGADVSGIHIDLSFERQILSALLEIVPPGVDEVLAIFRILDLLVDRSQVVAIDMAPTGHALELLRMPERILAWTRPLLKTLATHRTLAAARDAAVKIAGLGQRVRELTGLLKDSKSTQIHVVLLPELLPDHETERMISSLRTLHLTPKSMFLNRVIFAKDVVRCQRCRRSFQSQQKMITAIKKKFADVEMYVVHEFSTEIAGKTALGRFTGELWQLA